MCLAKNIANFIIDNPPRWLIQEFWKIYFQKNVLTFSENWQSIYHFAYVDLQDFVRDSGLFLEV